MRYIIDFWFQVSMILIIAAVFATCVGVGIRTLGGNRKAAWTLGIASWALFALLILMAGLLLLPFLAAPPPGSSA